MSRSPLQWLLLIWEYCLLSIRRLRASFYSWGNIIATQDAPRFHISLNIHKAPDRERLFNFIRQTVPTVLLVMDDLGLARDLKQLSPNTRVIFRESEGGNDGSQYKRWSPDGWLRAHAYQAEGGIYLHVLNEPAFDRTVLAWLVALMKENINTLRATLVLGDWAVGNPNPDDLPLAREFLQLCADYPDLFVVGLHEYCDAVVTSGLYGGYPDNAGVAPGQPGGKNLIRPENWPQDVTTITCWHMGRFKFWLEYCDSVGIPYPRIIVTEHSFDDCSDIKAWAETLIKTPPWLNIRGWQTLLKQWAVWYPEWTVERVYFEMIAWADRVIYARSPVEGQCIFCWGHLNNDWVQFDIAEAYELQALLIERATMTETIPFPKADDPGWMTGSIVPTVASNVNVRSTYSLSGAVRGQIPMAGLTEVQFHRTVLANNGDWQAIKFTDASGRAIEGYVRNDLVQFRETVTADLPTITILLPPSMSGDDQLKFLLCVQDMMAIIRRYSTEFENVTPLLS